MKKRLVSFGICAALALTLCGCNNDAESAPETEISAPQDGDRVNPVEESKPEWEYKEEDGAVRITVYNGKETAVKIPERLDGKPVTAIDDRVFVHTEDVKSVEIPATVTEIDDAAFEFSVERVGVAEGNAAFFSKDGIIYEKESGALFLCPCGRNGEVTIPEGTRKIADWAFSSCGVTSVVVPEGVEYLGWGAFAYCEQLKSVKLPSTLTEIDGGAFKGCLSLETLKIPETVTEIGSRAFEETPFLEKLRAKDPLVVISNILVDGQAAKGEVVIPDGVVKISGHAFEVEYSENPNITKVTIPDSVTEIGECAFSGCVNLTEAKLSSGIREIPIQTFADCKSLKNVDIPNGVAIIGSNAFKNCAELSQVNVPDTVTVCYLDDCFRGCEKVNVTFKGNTYTAVNIKDFYRAVDDNYKEKL